jgi:hypothetical protein
MMLIALFRVVTSTSFVEPILEVPGICVIDQPSSGRTGLNWSPRRNPADNDDDGGLGGE